MDGKRSDGEEQPSSAERNSPPAATEGGPSESFGVVKLERLVKDDGRALIVFSRPPTR